MIFEHKNQVQIARLTDNIELKYPIPRNEKEALDYLYFIDRTLYDNAYSLDIINYEKLIYIEQTFFMNKTVQQLFVNIKENIANNFLIKHKYIQRLTDDLCDKELDTTYKQEIKRFDRNLILRGSADFEYVI